MAGPVTQSSGPASGGHRRHEGRFLAWVIVLALGFALFTLYDYSRTGFFGRSYFLAAFFVLGTLLLITFFVALRPLGVPPAASRATVAAPKPADETPIAPSGPSRADSSSTVPRPDSLGARVEASKEALSSSDGRAPRGIRFLRRRVAYDAPTARVVKSEYDVNGMMVRDYDVVTDDESYSFRNIERRLDRLRLDPVPTMGPGGDGGAWRPPGGSS